MTDLTLDDSLAIVVVDFQALRKNNGGDFGPRERREVHFDPRLSILQSSVDFDISVRPNCFKIEFRLLSFIFSNVVFNIVLVDSVIKAVKHDGLSVVDLDLFGRDISKGPLWLMLLILFFLLFFSV